MGLIRRPLVASNFLEYFYYFILVIVAVTVLLGGPLYFYFSNAMEEQTLKINKTSLEQLMNSQQVVLDEVNRSFSMISLNSAFEEYPNYLKAGSEKDLPALHQQMDSVMTLNNYINDFYLYYPADSLILDSKQRSSRVDGFYDADFDRELDKLNIVDTYAVGRVVSESENQAISAVTFVKPVFFQYSGKPLAYVVINIRAFNLQGVIDSMRLEENASIAVSDRQGNTIGLRKGSDPGIISYFREYIRNNFLADSGNLPVTLHGEKYVLSYIYSSKYNWVYMYTVAYSDITGRLKVIGIITVAICLSVLGISVIASYFLSKKLYFPIKSIVGILGGNQTGNPAKGKIKETEYIRRNVSNLIDVNQNLERRLEDYMMLQKHVFLTELLSGKAGREDGVGMALAGYGMPLDSGGLFTVILLSVDNYASFISKYNEKQKNMLSIYLKDFAEKELLKYYKGFTVQMGENDFYIVLNLDAGSGAIPASESELLNQRIDSLHRAVSENMSATFTIGVSAAKRGIGSLPQCREQAQAAVNYRLVMGYGKVIHYERMPWKDARPVSYPYHLEQEILRGLKTGDLEEITRSLDEFIGRLSGESSENIEYLRFYFLQLVASSYDMFYELDLGSPEELGFPTDTFEGIMKEETMQGIAEQIKKLYGKVMRLGEDRKTSRNRELVLSVKEYIKANINTELSVAGIAEKYYVSTSYLRKVFKAEENKTLKDYINEAKMSKALELLEQSDKKIGDIANEVGYYSVPAFIKAFKLATAKTPSEYRADFVLKNTGKSPTE